MTKEELAKKKGMKLPEKKQSPAETLLTASATREEKSSVPESPKTENKPAKASRKSAPAVPADVPDTENAAGAEQETKRARAGRPKGPGYTKISANIQNDFYDWMTIAAGIGHKGNISGYLNSLIEKDLLENGEIYSRIKNFSGSR